MGTIGKDKVEAYNCATFHQWQTVLRKIRFDDGRTDMELSGKTNQGWFYVYDAFNDGYLGDPLDKVLLGGNKKIDPKTCETTLSDETRPQNQQDYAAVYQEAKAAAVQYHVTRFLDHSSWNEFPDHNDPFFGEWANFYQTDEGFLGFKAEYGERFCADEERRILGAVKTLIDIDEESYPAGMALLRGARDAVIHLRAATKAEQVNPADLSYSMARHFNRYAHESNCQDTYCATQAFWRNVLFSIDSRSDVCGWSPEALEELATFWPQSTTE
ncbi:MAG: hypothetical protein Q7S68_03960 [Deltaproteobacteria bacterium]|nr:hypothetical protein [Deltaproteobacteria bacterium]